jgi:hypothetical protein
MAYNFELSISARLSSKVVEDIIKTIVEEQTGRKVASIEPKLGQEQRGMGPNAVVMTVFDGYQINFASEKPQMASSNKPEFKEDRYE